MCVGGGGVEGERVKARPQIPPEKDRRDMDRRQSNGSVKAVSPRHCPATSALRNCCFNCCAWAESQGQCPLHWLLRNDLKRKKSNFRSPAPPPCS